MNEDKFLVISLFDILVSIRLEIIRLVSIVLSEFKIQNLYHYNRSISINKNFI